jgi:hypothetical protein
MRKWRKIGEVGVDSGQLMLCDPCYIDSEWSKQEFTASDRIYRDKGGKTWQLIITGSKRYGG